MSHDQIFKELLRAFFAEFVSLFFPSVAAELHFESVRFLEQEIFTDFPEGDPRRADTIAEVETRSGEPEVVLFHVEAENLRRSEFRFRMWEYYSLIRLRTKRPVFPIVIYLSRGTGGIKLEAYTETTLGTQFLNFQYWAVGLPDLSADDYRNGENLVGVALSALMQPSAVGSVLQKWEAILRILESEIDESRRMLLATIVENYLSLTETETETYERMVAERTPQEAVEMISYYEQRGIQKGIEQGLEQGLEQGRVEGQQTLLLKMLQRKFGEIPEALEIRVRSLDAAALEDLSERILTATSLGGIGLE